MSKYGTFSLFLACFGILFFVTINYTLSNIAGPYIVSDLGGSNDISFYTITFYSIGYTLGVPIAKWLLQKFSVAKILVGCLLLSALFSWTSAIAGNFPAFIGSRLLQGMACGPFFPVISYLFSFVAPKEKNDLIITIILTIFTIGPVTGACWGGWIAYDFHWTWIFYFNIAPLLLVAWFLWNHLKDFQPPIEKKIFDGIGYLFYCIGIFCLAGVIATGQQLDWYRSNLIIAMTIISGLSLLFFLLWEWYHPEPLFDFRMLKHFAFSFALFSLVLLFSSYFGMVLLLSQWLVLTVRYTPLWIGLILGIMGVAAILPVFLVRRFGRIDCRIPLAIAVLLFAISCFHTMFFNQDINFGRIAFSRALAGFGLALFLPPLFRLCFHSFAQVQQLNVVFFFQVTRILASGLGAAAYLTIWQRRQVFYHDRLGGQLTVLSPQTDAFFAKAETFHLKGLPAAAQLNQELNTQATALALDDCFYLMAWIVLGLFVLILLTRFFKCKGFIPEETV